MGKKKTISDSRWEVLVRGLRQIEKSIGEYRQVPFGMKDFPLGAATALVRIGRVVVRTLIRQDDMDVKTGVMADKRMVAARYLKEKGRHIVPQSRKEWIVEYLRKFLNFENLSQPAMEEKEEED